MKRLLIFHPTIFSYRIDFFNDLARAFDVRVCLQGRNLSNTWLDYGRLESQFDFEPIYLPKLCRVGSRKIHSGYWKHLDDFDPDIVLVSEFGLDALAVLLHRWVTRKKYKIVSMCDDSYDMVAGRNDFSRVHRLMRRVVTPLLDELILVESYVTRWYRERYGKGIFFPIIKDDVRAREEYTRAFPLSRQTVAQYGLDGKRVFMFAGRLIALKNVETIIRACVRLSSDKNTLVIVGSGPEEENLRRLAGGAGNIIFAGRQEGDELNRWYNLADCFVLASTQEAFGAVTNEALLAGCWGLISDRAGSRCLIEEGLNGWTFDPANVDDLAEKMMRIAEISAPVAPASLKPNRMNYSYAELHNKLIDELKNLCH
jgi:glycosyltransferase involved in cell wall biosynthesis